MFVSVYATAFDLNSVNWRGCLWAKWPVFPKGLSTGNMGHLACYPTGKLALLHHHGQSYTDANGTPFIAEIVG